MGGSTGGGGGGDVEGGGRSGSVRRQANVRPKRDKGNKDEGYVSILKKDEEAGTSRLRSSGEAARWSLSDRGSRDLPRFITP